MTTSTSTSSPCVVFMTHRWSRAIARHFARLKREAGPVLPVYLAYQLADSAEAPPAGANPDIVVRMADTARLFPRRHAVLSERSKPWGYVDIVWMTAFAHPSLAGHDQFWLMEYDVDFNGDWADFFRPALAFEGDLLVTRMRRLSEEPNWSHGPELVFPEQLTADPLLALFCLSRLSRRLVEGYRAAVAEPPWSGHFEALIPTFADAAGMSIAEISGDGRWTPAERINHFYLGSWKERARFRTSWSFGPCYSHRYFDQRRFGMDRPNTLCHPIKADASPRLRLRYAEHQVRFTLKALLGR